MSLINAEARDGGRQVCVMMVAGVRNAGEPGAFECQVVGVLGMSVSALHIWIWGFSPILLCRFPQAKLDGEQR